VVVGRSGELLITSEHHVVASGPQDGRDAIGHVLVEFDGGHRYAEI
jgi:hypothetical protein